MILLVTILSHKVSTILKLALEGIKRKKKIMPEVDRRAAGFEVGRRPRRRELKMGRAPPGRGPGRGLRSAGRSRWP